MIRFRPFDLSRDWAWFSLHNPIKRVEDTCGVVAYKVETEERIAACVLDSFGNNSVSAHLTIMNPICIKSGFFEHLADFIFTVCELDMVVGQVPANNVKAIKLNKHLGYEEVYRIPDGYDRGIDMVFMILKKENCIYFKKVKHIEGAT